MTKQNIPLTNTLDIIDMPGEIGIRKNAFKIESPVGKNELPKNLNRLIVVNGKNAQTTLFARNIEIKVEIITVINEVVIALAYDLNATDSNVATIK